ncbi:hypothetical protein V5799_009514 [Amblyomma americanum]|uniref:Uncharacterized protein n=1 Tax=Amblyomma americanum TaxID=6943 RepID=A0AAQ4FBJ7_AMBAM
MDDEDLQLLFGWLRDSRQMHSLTMWSRKESSRTAMQTLATCLQSNFSLTSIVMKGFGMDKTLKLEVLNLVRRNYGLLHCALGFALGSVSKRTAAAFELVSSHPKLLQRVQRIGSLSHAEAEIRISEGERRIRHEISDILDEEEEDLASLFNERVDPPSTPSKEKANPSGTRGKENRKPSGQTSAPNGAKRLRKD